MSAALDDASADDSPDSLAWRNGLPGAEPEPRAAPDAGPASTAQEKRP